MQICTYEHDATFPDKNRNIQMKVNIERFSLARHQECLTQQTNSVEICTMM